MDVAIGVVGGFFIGVSVMWALVLAREPSPERERLARRLADATAAAVPRPIRPDPADQAPASVVRPTKAGMPGSTRRARAIAPVGKARRK